MSRDMLGIVVRKLVTLESSTLGVVCDLLEKLSDPMWIKALKKFLRKENPWEFPKFSTWKTIKLGTHQNIDALKKAITEADIHISDWASDIMSKSAFILASQEDTIELVTATVAELGFSGNTRYDEICARIKELGYALCPAEVGPQLRLQYPDQPAGEYLYLAMEPITGSDGDLFLFYVEPLGRVRWLCTRCNYPDDAWDPDYRFIFMRRKQSVLWT